MPRGWAAPQVTYARWVECPCPFARAAAHNESRKVWCLFLSGRPAATANFRSPTSSSRSAIRASVRAAYIQRKAVRRASPSVAHDKSRRRFSRGNCHPSQQHPEEPHAVVSVDMGQRSFDVKHGANYSRRGSRPVCQPGHPPGIEVLRRAVLDTRPTQAHGNGFRLGGHGEAIASAANSVSITRVTASPVSSSTEPHAGHTA
jgi:hypothetical protein